MFPGTHDASSVPFVLKKFCDSLILFGIVSIKLDAECVDARFFKINCVHNGEFGSLHVQREEIDVRQTI
tara:strand:+ start:207 stop:413 length:207 start_codon:yes stop_codon:yes gene_type:complete